MDEYEKKEIFSFVVKCLIFIAVIIGALVFAFNTDATGSEKVMTVAFTVIFCLMSGVFLFIEIRKVLYGIMMSGGRKKIK